MKKIGVNEPCPCGSGKKYKKCCLQRDELWERQRMARESQSLPQGPESEEVTVPGSSVHSIFGFWTKAEAEELETGEIVRRLRRMGIEFDEAVFRQDAARLMSAQALKNQWFESFEIHARGRDEDFPFLAARVLWDRLCPDVASVEQMKDRISDGYDLLEGEPRHAEACRLWLAAWEMLVTHFASGSRAVEDLDEELDAYESFPDWCLTLAEELGLAALDDDYILYHAKRVAYCRQFLDLFPDSDPDILRRMQCAQAESRFELEGPERGDEEFRKLTEAHPDWLWGYTTWSDMYTSDENADPAKAEAICRLALERGVKDEDGELAERLEELAKERGGE